jgi:hypothetical protein
VSGELAAVSADVMPYLTTAVSAYGGAVQAKARDDAADATVGLGRKLAQRIFGARKPGEPVPVPLADLVADPADPDAAGAVRLSIRKALAADPRLLADIRHLLAAAGPVITASGDRSVAAQHITGSVIATGDHAHIRRDGVGRSVGGWVGVEASR